MAGISSKAEGTLQNNKQYNGIEHTTDLDLNQYDAFYRTLDPQTGRFWQPDPEAESLDSYSPYESMGNNPISNTDPLGNFRTRFGAWLHKIFNGGGTIGENKYGEYYVSKNSTSTSEDGTVTVTATVSYGKGRDKYSAAREKLLDEIQQDQSRSEDTRLGIWDPNMSAEDARFSALRLVTNLVLPTVIIKPVTIATNLTKVVNLSSKSLAELRAMVGGKNAALLRGLFGANETGAKAVLDNIKNVKIPEGLTKETMETYRELINRVPDSRGTQAIRAQILDKLLK